MVKLFFGNQRDVSLGTCKWGRQPGQSLFHAAGEQEAFGRRIWHKVSWRSQNLLLPALLCLAPLS